MTCVTLSGFAAPSSNGSDVALSRPKYGFDSRWGYSPEIQASRHIQGCSAKSNDPNAADVTLLLRPSRRLPGQLPKKLRSLWVVKLEVGFVAGNDLIKIERYND